MTMKVQLSTMVSVCQENKLKAETVRVIRNVAVTLVPSCLYLPPTFGNFLITKQCNLSPTTLTSTLTAYCWTDMDRRFLISTQLWRRSLKTL